MKQLALDLAAPPAPAYDNFVPGSNAELLARLRTLMLAGDGERMIYLWGERGSGRTHLLKASVKDRHQRGERAFYLACEPGVALPEGPEPFDCVALDDVERLDEGAQIALFHLYNTMRERGGTLITSGNAPPAQLALRPDLVTRLGWGLVYRVQALSDDDKAEALAGRAGALGFPLPHAVGDYLLAHVRRDLPSLLAMLDGLDRYSRETKRAVTVPLVREFIQAVEAGSPPVLPRGDRD